MNMIILNKYYSVNANPRAYTHVDLVNNESGFSLIEIKLCGSQSLVTLSYGSLGHYNI